MVTLILLYIKHYMPHNVTGRSGTNVYVNTNLTATLPLIENQSNFNNFSDWLDRKSPKIG